MNLKDLEYFNCLCKTKNFTKTSQMLYVSQPSITMSLKRLEKELDTKLIVRDHSASELSLTDAGKMLQKSSQNILNEISKVKFDISQIISSKVKFGVPPMIGAYFFPDLMQTLAKHNLVNQIELVETGSFAMKNLLISGEIHMALIGSLQPIKSTKFSSTILKVDDFVFCTNKNNKLSEKEKINFRELKNERFIVLGDSYIHNKVIKKLCAKNNISTKNFYYTDEIQTAKSLIASNLGVGIMINMAVENVKNIIKVSLNNPIKFYISLITRKEICLSKDEAKIRNIILKNFNLLS